MFCTVYQHKPDQPKAHPANTSCLKGKQVQCKVLGGPVFTLGQGLHGGYECKTNNTEHAWAVEMSPGLPTQRRRGEREGPILLWT